MHIARLWLFPIDVSIEAVSSVKVLADVPSDVLLESETTPRVLVHEFSNVHDILVEKNECSTLLIHQVMKLGFRNVLQVIFDLKIDLFPLLQAIQDFSNDPNRVEEQVDPRDDLVAFVLLAVVSEVSHDSRRDSCLTEDDGEVGGVFVELSDKEYPLRFPVHIAAVPTSQND